MFLTFCNSTKASGEDTSRFYLMYELSNCSNHLLQVSQNLFEVQLPILSFYDNIHALCDWVTLNVKDKFSRLNQEQRLFGHVALIVVREVTLLWNFYRSKLLSSASSWFYQKCTAFFWFLSLLSTFSILFCNVEYSRLKHFSTSVIHSSSTLSKISFSYFLNSISFLSLCLVFFSVSIELSSFLPALI